MQMLDMSTSLLMTAGWPMNETVMVGFSLIPNAFQVASRLWLTM
jgi:hypothetical protein